MTDLREMLATSDRVTNQARAERDKAWGLYLQAITERDEARAQVRQLTARQTEADDLRARVRQLADVIENTRDDLFPDIVAEDIRATLHAERAGTVHTGDSGASVDPSATPDLLGPQIGAEGIES